MVTIILAAEMLLMTFVGIFIQKKHIASETFAGELTKFMMNIALPCLIFQSMTSVDASWEQLVNCGVVFLCSLLVCAINFALGQLFYRLLHKSSYGRIVRYGIIFTHFSFMGIPLVEMLYGAEGLLYYSIFLIPIRALYYGLTELLLTPPESRKDRETFGGLLIKTLTNPCLVAVIVGLVFYIIFGLVISDFTWDSVLPAGPAAAAAGVCTCISWVISKLTALCTPLGLLICGMTLGKMNFRELLDIRFLRLPILRCVVLPTIFLGVLKLIELLFHPDILILSVVLVYSSLPIASLIPAYTIRYDPDPRTQAEAAGALLYSTLLSMITVPIWCRILSAGIL